VGVALGVGASVALQIFNVVNAKRWYLMFRAVIFFNLVTSAFASQTLDVPINAAVKAGGG
jgi:hypothetical protein